MPGPLGHAVAVYTGAELPALDLVGASPSGAVTFRAQAGTTYHIAVASDTEPGPAVLSLTRSTAPPNDRIAWALEIPAPSAPSYAGGPVVGTLTDATLDAEEEALGFGRPVVWYRLSVAEPAAFVPVVAEVAGSGAEPGTVLFVEEDGGVTALDASTETDEPFQAQLAPGESYLLAVYKQTSTTNPDFTLTYQIVAAPANDLPAGATDLGGVEHIATEVDVTAAATHPDEPTSPELQRTVWFRWTAAADGILTLEADAGDPRLDLELFREDGGFVPLGSTLGTGGRVAQLQAVVSAGSAYLVVVGNEGTIGDAAGTLELTFSEPSANGSFAGRLDLGVGSGAFATGDTTRSAAGEWFTWTADRDGVFEFDFFSEVTLRAHFFTGEDEGSLVSSGDFTSGVGYPLFQGGVTYHFQVMPHPAYRQHGTFAFSLTEIDPPPNNTWQTATPLPSQIPLEFVGSNRGATGEGAEAFPELDSWRRPSWFRWVAPRSADVSIGIQHADDNKTGAPAYAVYTEAEDGSFELILYLSNYVQFFEAVAGTEYLIAVGRDSTDGGGEFEGTLWAPAEPGPPPPNDMVADAFPLEAVDGLTLNAVTENATREPSEAFLQGWNSVWWRWVPQTSQMVVFDVPEWVGMRFTLVEEATMRELTMPGVAPFRVGWNDFRYLPEPGKAYLLRATGDPWAPEHRQVVLRLPWLPPANDEIAGATDLGAVFRATVSAPIHRGTVSLDEPEDSWPTTNAFMPRRTLWWRWTAPATGVFAFSSAATKGDVRIVVYDQHPSTTPAVAAASGSLTLSVTKGHEYWLALGSADYDSWDADYRQPADPNPLLVASATLTVEPITNLVSAPGQDREGAPTLAGTGTFEIPLVGAMRDVSVFEAAGIDPHHGGAVAWRRWRAPAAGTYLAHEGSGRASVAVFEEGEGGQPTFVTHGSSLTFEAAVDGMFWVAVIGPSHEPAEPAWLSLARLDTHGNDLFAGAVEVAGAPLAHAVAPSASAFEPGEPIPPSGLAAAGSRWWRWTVPATATYRIQPAGGPQGSRKLAVFDGGSLDGLTLLGSSLDGTELRLALGAGQTVSVAVYPAASDTPAGLVIIPVTAPAPPNDHFADRTLLEPNFGVRLEVDLAGGSVETCDPWELIDGRPGQPTAWWEWSPPTDQIVVLRPETLPPSTNVWVAVPTESGGGLEVLYAGSIDPEKPPLFVALEGEIVYLGVSVRAPEAAGTIAATLEAAGSPGSDSFAGRVALPSGDGVAIEGSLMRATTDPGEPSTYIGWHATRWFEWTAPEDGIARVRRAPGLSQPAQVLPAVYEGEPPGSLVSVGGEWDDPFEVAAGRTYQIAVGSPNQNFGTFAFVLDHAAAPANDHFWDATDLGSDVPAYLHGPTLAATPEGDGPAALPPDVDTGDRTAVWFRWRAPHDGQFYIEGGSSHVFERRPTGRFVRVWTGPVADSLDEPYNSVPTDLRSFDGRAGDDYWIAIAGSEAWLREYQQALGDSFSEAIVLAGSRVGSSVGRLGASTEPGEPAHALFDEGSVWLEWVAPQNGNVEARLEGEGAASAGLAVYRGEEIGNLAPVTPLHGDEAHGDDDHFRFRAEAGTTYRFAVFNNTSDFDELPPVEFVLGYAPANDDFEGRTRLLGGTLAFGAASLEFATWQPGEPVGSLVPDGWRTAWWEWTPSASGVYRLDVVAESGRPLEAGVFTGDAVTRLSPVAQGAGSVVFGARAGQRYHISIDGRVLPGSADPEADATAGFSVRLDDLPPAYEAWAEAFLPGVPIPDRLPLSDLTGDGWNHLDHLAFATDPLSAPDPSHLPRVAVADGSRLALAFVRPTDHSAVSYRIHFTARPGVNLWRTLVEGTDYTLVAEDNGDGTETVLAELSEELSSGASGFARVVVELR